jgi:hypothetical protein
MYPFTNRIPTRLFASVGLFLLLSSSVFAQKDNLPDPDCLRKSHAHHSDCAGNPPCNNIIDSVFPHSKYVFSKDSMNSYSWVNIKNGDKLLLTNSSCDAVTLDFQFTTSRFSADTTDYKYWYPKALELMKEVEKGIASGPVRIPHGIDTLESFITQYPDSLKLGHVIRYDYDTNPPDDVTSDPISYNSYEDMFPHMYINRIEGLPDKKYMIEIYFSISLNQE